MKSPSTMAGLDERDPPTRRPKRARAAPPPSATASADLSPVALEILGTIGGATSALKSRNIVVGGRRTSMRLEPTMWQALSEIAERENLSINEICTVLDRQRSREATLTSVVRTFIARYFRSAATEASHRSVGHGGLSRLQPPHLSLVVGNDAGRNGPGAGEKGG